MYWSPKEGNKPYRFKTRKMIQAGQIYEMFIEIKFSKFVSTKTYNIRNYIS